MGYYVCAGCRAVLNNLPTVSIVPSATAKPLRFHSYECYERAALQAASETS